MNVEIESEDPQHKPAPGAGPAQSMFQSQYEPAPNEDVNVSTMDDGANIQEQLRKVRVEKQSLQKQIKEAQLSSSQPDASLAMHHKLEDKGGSKIQLLHLILVAIIFLALGSFLGGTFLQQKLSELQ